MDLATIGVEVGIAVSGIVGTAIVYAVRAGELKEQVKQLADKLKNHIEIDERHHREEQEQWQENNRSLGRIEGALAPYNPPNPRESRNKSRP